MFYEYETINIKENMPTVVDAMEQLKSTLRLCQNLHTHFLVIIHGYGSTGKGGAIGKRARCYLEAEKKKGKIKRVVFGEHMSLFNEEARVLRRHCQSLDIYMDVYNHGITIVEI